MKNTIIETAPSSTSMSIYLLFIYLFIITMYCLFNQNIKSGDQYTNLKNLGYVIFTFFQVLAFLFLLWKIVTSGDEIKEKGFQLSDFIKNTFGKNPFGTYTTTLFYGLNGLIVLYLIAFIIYMKYQPPNINIQLNVFFFFVVFAIGLLSFLLYSNMKIPLYSVLIIGIILNAVSSILTTISLTNATDKITNLPPKQSHMLTVYTAITITDILLLLFLAALLFTRGFTLELITIPNMTQYKVNNGIVIFCSLSLIILSAYNIYNSNNLMLAYVKS